VSVIGFKDSQAGVEHLALRHHDDVVARRELVATENLAYQSLSAISNNGPSQFPSDRDSQTSNVALVRQGEHRRVAPVNPGAVFVNLLELRSPSNAFVAPKSSQINLRC